MDSIDYLERSRALRNNSTLFINYQKYLLADGKLASTKKTYSNKIIELLEYFDKLTLDQIKVDDIQEFIQLKKKELDEKPRNRKGQNRYLFIAAYRSFFKFANQSISLQFDPESIVDQSSSQKKAERNEPLSISEIIAIKEITNNSKFYRYLYTFEMFLTYGLKLDEIVECTRDTYFPDENAFIIGSRKIILRSVLNKLIADHEDLLERKTANWYQNNNKETGKLINRPDGLILSDIEKTRSLYFPTCPNCGFRYPNSDEFWVLAIHEDDRAQTKWLYCRSCAEENEIKNHEQ